MKKVLTPALIAAVAASAVALTSPDTDKPTAADLNNTVVAFSNTLNILQNEYVDTLKLDNIVSTGLNGMLSRIDPYTELYTPDNLDDLRSISTGDYGGIGCAISLRNDSLVVMSTPYYDSPARKAGIHHGDILLSINGEALFEPDAEKNLSNVTKRLRGQAGTHVTVQVRRPWLPDGTDSIFDIDIEREKIKIDPLPFYTILDGGIAYFDVTTFNRNTASAIRRTFSEMKATKGDSLRGVILDLRSNGGGITVGAVDLLSIFMPRNTHSYTARYRDREPVVTKTHKSPVDTRIPLAVLINSETASASEIVAGAIQDLDRGVIVGEKSYGKGLIQTSSQVSPDMVLKYTSGRYYLPSGRLIQAIDYSLRDGRGRSTETDSAGAVYTTAHGRKVTGGRGITPDLKVETDTIPEFVYALYISNTFDDFANRYRNNRSDIPSEADTLATDYVMAEFKAFINPDKVKYDRRSDNGIKFLRDAARYERLDNDSVMQTLDLLERLMKHDYEHDFEAFKPDIQRMLDTEIASRYFSDAALSQRALDRDKVLEQARLLLLDTRRYKEYLEPEKSKDSGSKK